MPQLFDYGNMVSQLGIGPQPVMGDVVDIQKFLHNPDLLADQRAKIGAPQGVGGFGSRWRDPNFVRQEAVRRGLRPDALQPVPQPAARIMTRAQFWNPPFGDGRMSSKQIAQAVRNGTLRDLTGDSLAKIRQMAARWTQEHGGSMKDYYDNLQAITPSLRLYRNPFEGME